MRAFVKTVMNIAILSVSLSRTAAELYLIPSQYRRYRTYDRVVHPDELREPSLADNFVKTHA